MLQNPIGKVQFFVICMIMVCHTSLSELNVSHEYRTTNSPGIQGAPKIDIYIIDWNIMYVNLVCSTVCYFACPGIHSNKTKLHLKSNVKLGSSLLS